MKLIPLKRGYIQVDDDVYEWANRYSWTAHQTRTTVSIQGSINGEYVTLSRLIMNAPPDMQVDHVNGDPLDNRRENLRLATNKQNSANKPKREGTSSVYKGVHWHRRDRRWRASIKHNYKSIHLGSFLDEEDAARAYDTKAIELFGEFAITNF